LDWAQVSFLLTGDLEAKGEGYLLRSDRHLLADVLKVSHHGSAASSTDDFLAAVAPSYAVISVSEENNFGHPNPSVLDRLDQRRDLEVLRTDEQGTVEFTTDGHRLWIRTDR
jgi:competence protein ComEC